MKNLLLYSSFSLNTISKTQEKRRKRTLLTVVTSRVKIKTQWHWEEVEYFDVERHAISEPRVTLRFSKQSKCAEAKVQIDTVKGYQQIEDGKIVNTYTINTDTYEDKTSVAYLERNTGFQQRLTDDHQVDTEKNDIYNLISKLGNENFTGPSVFAGGTPLVYSNPPKYCYYKNDITT